MIMLIGALTHTLSTSVWGSELKWSLQTLLGSSYGSTSVWGSELKSFISIYHPSCYSLPLCEVVSWNVIYLFINFPWSRLPLCEVVSWNKEILLWKSAFTRSTSVWGSELKFLCCQDCSCFVLSTSVWGSELNVFEGSMWYCRFNPMMGKSGPQIFRACCTYSRSVVPERITVLI